MPNANFPTERLALCASIIEVLEQACNQLRQIAAEGPGEPALPKIKVTANIIFSLKRVVEKRDVAELAGLIGTLDSRLKELEQAQALRGQLFAEKVQQCLYALEDLAAVLLDTLENGIYEARTEPARRDLIAICAHQLKAQSFLQLRASERDSFKEINVPRKVLVDPFGAGTVERPILPFLKLSCDTFDLAAFADPVDAATLAEELLPAIARLRHNGCLIIPDTNPRFEIRSISPRISDAWQGDSWRVVAALHSRPELRFCTVPIERGVTVLLAGGEALSGSLQPVALRWEEFVQRREQLLRMISFENFEQWLTASTA